MGEGTDRPAALLTNAQRAYLRGEKEYSASAERDLRARIRERIRATIVDLSLLLDTTDPEELEQSLDLVEQREAHLDGVSAGLTDGIAFLFAANAAAYRGNDVTDPEMYETLVAESVRRTCRHAGVAADRVAVDVEIEGATPLEEFKVEDLADMPLSALRQRYLAGLISEEQFDRALDAKVDARASDAEE